jgi:hypothetical protein
MSPTTMMPMPVGDVRKDVGVAATAGFCVSPAAVPCAIDPKIDAYHGVPLGALDGTFEFEVTLPLELPPPLELPWP